MSETENNSEELRARIRQLEAENESLREMAMRDSKTGLWNERGLREMASFLIAEHARSGQPLSLLVLDIDNFKDLNTRFGNPAADRLMNELARDLLALTRHSDVVARHGGDEFVIIFTADADQMMKKFGSPSSNPLRFTKLVGEQTATITFSGGLARLRPDLGEAALDSALQDAFEAQLQAKKTKDQIVEFRE
jgi:diguanylate cyclase (GGDEF)-like protein